MNLATVHRSVRSLLTGMTQRIGWGDNNRVSSGSSQAVRQVRVRFRNKTLRLAVRTGTIDSDLIDLILCENSEYQLPDIVQPRVIFDVGANIGITAIYFSILYPDADIFCFEPLPENLELLRINTRHSSRIRVLPYGLSDTPGTFDYYMSDNPRSYGGGGFMKVGNDLSRKIELPLSTVAQAMVELGVDHVDLFKLDTEGSELAILRGMSRSVRDGAQAIIGELHGIGDWQVCQMLDRSHAVGINKRFNARCFPFLAVRKDLASTTSLAKQAA